MFLDAIVYLILSLCFIVPIVILALIAFVIFIVKRTKQMKLSKGVKIASSYCDNELLEMFGKDNIVSVECEMSRVTITVKNIDIVNTQGLQNKGASGILLVGNKVKCNFKENAENITNYLKGTLQND